MSSDDETYVVSEDSHDDGSEISESTDESPTVRRLRPSRWRISSAAKIIEDEDDASIRQQKTCDPSLSSMSLFCGDDTHRPVVVDDLVDTEEDADDEQDSDSDSDFCIEEDKTNNKILRIVSGEGSHHKRRPTSYSVETSGKENLPPRSMSNPIYLGCDKERETIDLCDSSSFDNGGDSDFTVEEEDDIERKKEIEAALALERKRNKMSKAAFQKNRDRLTQTTFDEFNRKAFGGKIGTVKVEWSKKLQTTAGLTRLQKITLDATPGIPFRRNAIVELSTKVVDDNEKLRNTLLHELVHAAVWILDGVSKPPHGADFKRWAKIATSKIPDVVVTTTHDYHIEYKFNWKCTRMDCTFRVGRHSRSVDIARHRCGLCRSTLVEVTPEGLPKKKAQPSAYNLFVKEYSKSVREDLLRTNRKATQADVMRELGRRWREQKASNS